jgi:hypothetical protein
MKFVDAMRTDDVMTTNGMPAHSSTLDVCLDLFSSVGGMRGQDKQSVINLFVKAFDENPLTAMKILFWTRDVRGGAGERQIFKDIIEYLANTRPDVLSKNVALIPEYGRWDDMFVLFGTPVEDVALMVVTDALKSGNQLCAKWCPRPNTKNVKDKTVANTIRKHMKQSPKEYRKLLVTNTDVVEQLMCANKWSEVEYRKVPSKAMSDYAAAFRKHDGLSYDKYLASVESGEVKINTGAVYPYNVLNMLRNGDTKAANTMWKNLPDYMEGNNERVIPVVDVSGSMSCPAGGSPSITCMDVAISLGMYISERNIGDFKDAFITFSAKPTLQYLKGALNERYNQLENAAWDMNTNLEAVFELILTKAKSSNLSEDEMPTTVLILSDMQFDQGVRRGGNAHTMITNQYKAAGYKLPKVVYWNLNDYGNKPVQKHQSGAALVSGFSPSLLKTLLSGEDMSPVSMMMRVIGDSRYDAVVV